jgi:hypothetical protein
MPTEVPTGSGHAPDEPPPVGQQRELVRQPDPRPDRRPPGRALVTVGGELGPVAVLIGGPCAGLVLSVAAHADLPVGWYRGHADVPGFGTYRIGEDADLLRRVVPYRWTEMTRHEDPQGRSTRSDSA